MSAVLPLWNYFSLLFPNTKHRSLLIYFTDSWRGYHSYVPLLISDRSVASSELRVNGHVSKYCREGLFCLGFFSMVARKWACFSDLSNLASKLRSTKITRVSVRVIIMDATLLLICGKSIWFNLIVFLGRNLPLLSFHYYILKIIPPYAKIRVYSLFFTWCIVITSGLKLLHHESLLQALYWIKYTYLFLRCSWDNVFLHKREYILIVRAF